MTAAMIEEIIGCVHDCKVILREGKVVYDNRNEKCKKCGGTKYMESEKECPLEDHFSEKQLAVMSKETKKILAAALSEKEKPKNPLVVSEAEILERANFYRECGWDMYKIEQAIQSGFFKEDIIRDRQGEIENQRVQEERQKQYESDLITSKQIAELKLKSNPIHQQKLREDEAQRKREIRQLVGPK